MATTSSSFARSIALRAGSSSCSNWATRRSSSSIRSVLFCAASVRMRFMVSSFAFRPLKSSLISLLPDDVSKDTGAQYRPLRGGQTSPKRHPCCRAVLQLRECRRYPDEPASLHLQIGFVLTTLLAIGKIDLYIYLCV